MKIFIDTANLNEITKANDMAIIDGVTTNPSLVAREGLKVKDAIIEIAKIVNGPISAEVMSLDYDNIINEAKELVKISENIVIKVPMCIEGLKAVKILTQMGIKTNVTLIFSLQQGILAARAGATYISPFAGRLDDIGLDGMDLVRDLVNAIKEYNLDTQVIAASIRHQKHIIDCIKSGVHVATIPFNQLVAMINHPLTEQGIEKFLEDYEKVIK